MPARELEFANNLTVKDLLGLLSKYLNDQVSPASNGADLESLLREDTEITIVVDGLDEVPRSHAAVLLARLADTVDHWPTVQVIATGRPVELQGISYEDWNVLSIVPLGDEEKFHFFEEEVRADGHGENRATEIASRLLNNLRSHARLNSLASTPLLIRLLYSKLSGQETHRSETLGDILADLVQERLGAWNEKDGKPTLTVFESEFPDPHSRAAVLGRLALAFGERTSMSTEEANSRLREFVAQYTDKNPLIVSSDALSFFARSGLVSVSDQVQFTFHPLFEVLCGIGLSDQWQTSPDSTPDVSLDRWRVISFFTSCLRRANALEEARPLIGAFVENVLHGQGGVPAAAYIVSESQDSQLAEMFVEGLRNLDPRPITFFYEERTQSARAIAESLKLAERTGFDWFFSSYLDPRYPPFNYGSSAADQVLKQWVALSNDDLTSKQRSQLGSVVSPHIRAGSSFLYSVIPILAILTPEAFTVEERLWFTGSLLYDGDLSEIAEGLLQHEFQYGDASVVNNVLLKHAQRGYENSAAAAHLWLKLNDGRPPIIVIRAIVKYIGYLSGYPNLNAAVDQIVARVGVASWRAFLRFYLYDGDHYLSAGAAVSLSRLGETRLTLLGPALLNGIHDGIRGREAEATLEKVIPANSIEALGWLAEEIGPKHKDFMESGAPSGWWRPFLARLADAKEKGPTLLGKSIQGIGCFLFARRAEIRQLFRDLLSGPYRNAYRLILEEKLSDLNPRVRHGAAMALTVCDPGNANTALAGC